MTPLKYQMMRFMRGPLNDETKPALNWNGKLPETFKNERRQDIEADEQLAETKRAICTYNREQKVIEGGAAVARQQPDRAGVE
jgi:hypothetical protein